MAFTNHLLKPGRNAALIAGVLLLSNTAFAQITPITWSSNDSFETSLQLAPGATQEVCGLIDPRQPIDWRFSSNEPTSFDIHRHSGNEVIYSTRSYGTRETQGKLKPTFAYDWCWTWKNEGAGPASISIKLKR